MPRAPGYADTVVALRLTGLNASTAETHLPAQSPAKLTNLPACLVGHDHLRGDPFPGFTFELVLWPGTNDRFPPIDDNGTVVTPMAATDQAQYDAMVAEAAPLRVGAPCSPLSNVPMRHFSTSSTRASTRLA